MSILLEALRKSEKSQRPSEPPTIHDGDQGGPASDSIRIVPLISILVAALLVIGWLIWRQYQPSGDVYQPPVSLPVTKGAAMTPTVAETDKGDSTAAETRQTKGPSDGKRTPVESYQQVASKAGPSKSKNTDGPAKKTVNQAESQSTITHDGKTTEALLKEAKAKQQNANKTKATQNTDKLANEDKEYKPQEPAPISYWELPDAIRADVPEIKFSVLVYSKEPADRFVLVNGQRLKEGDSFQQGLVVEEIRRDGVVFSYRLYRFMVER